MIQERIKCKFSCRGCINKNNSGYCELLKEHYDGKCKFHKTFNEERNDLLLCFERNKERLHLLTFKEYLLYLDHEFRTLKYIRFLEENEDE